RLHTASRRGHRITPARTRLPGPACGMSYTRPPPRNYDPGRSGAGRTDGRAVPEHAPAARHPAVRTTMSKDPTRAVPTRTDTAHASRADHARSSADAPAPYRHEGRGRPVLLIHPFLMTHEVWTEVVDELAEDHEVLAVTLPGHWGGPDARWGATGVTDMADAVETVLDDHGWGTCHVVGNSLGGWVAFELEQRGRARSVTAIAPAGGWTTVSMPAVRLGVTFLALAPVMWAAKPFASWAVEVRRIQTAALSAVTAHPATFPFHAAKRAMTAAVRT